MVQELAPQGFEWAMSFEHGLEHSQLPGLQLTSPAGKEQLLPRREVECPRIRQC